MSAQTLINSQITSRSGATILKLAVLIIGIAGLISYLLVLTYAAGSTYYVATGGSDTSGCGTANSPCATIAYAANSRASAGDTVIVTNGTYSQTANLTNSGRAGAPITITGSGNPTVTGFIINDSYVTIQNLTISGASGDCMTVAPALSNITITGNSFRNCGGTGINFTRPGNPPSANYTSNVNVSADTFDGMGGSYGDCLRLYANNVSVTGIDCTNVTNDAIDAWGDSISVTNSNFHDISNTLGNHNDVVQTWTGTNDGAEGNPLTKFTFAQNKVTNILGGNAHVLISQGPGHQNWNIYDNLIQNIGDESLIIDFDGAGQTGTNIYNNTFVFGASYPSGSSNFATLDIGNNVSGFIANNIFYNSRGYTGGYPYSLGTGDSVTTGYNLSGGTSPTLPTGSGNINADPKFVNSSSDFHLLSGSPAIDAGDPGTIVNPERYIDLDSNLGVSGGRVDMGAYEFQSSTSAYDSTVLGDHPSAYWSMNGASSSESDLTGNSHSGSYCAESTYLGGQSACPGTFTPSLDTMPNGDHAVKFNETACTRTGASSANYPCQYMKAADSNAFSISTAKKLTLEAWIKPNALQFPFDDSAGSYVDWAGKCETYSGNCEWEGRMYNQANSQYRCDMLDGYVFNQGAGLGSAADWGPAGANSSQIQAYTNYGSANCTQSILQADQWLHVVIEYQTLTTPSQCDSSYPGTITIWVNGVPQNFSYHEPTGCMSQYGITPGNYSSPVDIGTMAHDSFFDGAIGKVAIYDSLLSQAQINSHFAAMTGAAVSGSCGSHGDCVIPVPTQTSTAVTGDLNGDGHVNVFDLSLMLSNWQSTSYATGDLNSDGVVNIFDLSILLSHYGT